MNKQGNATSKEVYIRLLNKTEDYIEQHLKESITLIMLAENANLSKFHFHRLFKKCSSETVNEFVIRFKIERTAIFLCVNPNISLTTIAMEYGYSDSSSFSRAFKRHFGISPLNYRKQSRSVDGFMAE